MYLLLAAAIAALPRLMFRFGGEDPIKGSPWYHEKITREAAIEAGFSPGSPTRAAPDGAAAVNGLAWHADFVDSYLYNPLWNAGGGLERFRAAMFAHDDMVKVHFDDCTSTAQIELAWNRYLGGTVAGLLWAADRGDVAAARHVVGVGLHALQDFYAHSNWVDEPKRRARTWLETPAADREGMHLYTGTYEHEDHFGFKPHGKLSLDCTMMRELVGSTVMDTLCDPISPLSDSGLCRRWRECQSNSTPTAPTEVVGVPVPVDIVWLQPPGIALDSTWLAKVNGRNRDVPGTHPDPEKLGLDLFAAARALAHEHTREWLRELGKIMAGQGLADFWKRVREEPRQGERHGQTLPLDSDALPAYDADLEQYESPDKLPLTFLSAGKYPPDPTGADEGWFVRLELRTADDEAATGTGADIDVAIGGREFRLDHGTKDNRLMAYDDFDSGESTFYVVGPFDAPPTGMVLHNRGGGALDVLEGAWEDLKTIVGNILETIGDILLSLIGGGAEYSGSDKLTWSWPELVAVAASGGQDLEWHCQVEGEGDYRITGRLTATPEPDGSITATITPGVLHCIQESTVDQGSSDDEPFFLLVLNSPAAGTLTKGRSRKFKGVDSGESRDLDMPDFRISVPRHGGLIVPVQVWESDDEGSDKRDEILDHFATRYLEDTEEFRSQFLDALGAAIGTDWKLGRYDAYAYRRGHLTRTAHLARGVQVNRWVEGGGSLPLDFDEAPVTRSVLVAPLEPVVRTVRLQTDGNVSALALVDGAVLAAAAPHRPDGQPVPPGVLYRLGTQLQPGATVPAPNRPRSLAVGRGHDRLYVVGHDGRLAAYDATTLAELAAVTIGFGAMDVAVDPANGLVWVTRWLVNGGSVHLFRLDLTPVAVFSTPDGFHGPLGVAAHPTQRSALVARSFRSGGPTGPVVSGYAGLTAAADGTVTLTGPGSFPSPASQPVDAAFDAPAGLAFVTCLGAGVEAPPRLVVLDAATPHAVLGTVDLPANGHAVATLPGTGRAYVATDLGLVVVDGHRRKVELVLRLGRQSRVIAVDPATGATYLGDAQDGSVRRVDTAEILG